jgi:[protein-PII] uridylyltransferase
LFFLVHKHLLMAHLAFRRDISDLDLLVRFSHEVGSPETLRMLFALTAADVMAVGPGIWTSWKAELLAQLFDAAMLHLSGEHFAFQQQERIERVKQTVRNKVKAGDKQNSPAVTNDWIDRQLQACQRHYLTGTDPGRIAADLNIVHGLQPFDVVVDTARDRETGTIDYRVILHENRAAGCFHRIAGALTSKRLDILAAQISTMLDGTVIDSFRVLDNDFSGDVPNSRLEEVKAAVRTVLTGATTVDELFPVPRRFNSKFRQFHRSNLTMRVAIDNDSSSRFTIVDVFAHDRPGLLYTLSRAISKLGLSVLLAKIATHVDQVVDVFYVTESDGKKVEDAQRLAEIRGALEACMRDFEQQGYKAFIA